MAGRLAGPRPARGSSGRASRCSPAPTAWRARGVSAYPPEVTQQMVKNFLNGGAAINQLAAAIDADLRIYELDLDHPTDDFTQGPAMSEARDRQRHGLRHDGGRARHRRAVPGRDGHRQHHGRRDALRRAVRRHAAPTGPAPAPASQGKALAHKIAVIDEALAHHKDAIAARDPLTLLAAVGGEEFAAIAGAIVAARMGRIPVLLDGYACTAAAAVLYAADRRALDHCLVAHRSAEPGHTRLLAGDRPAPAARPGHAAGRGLGGGARRADPEGRRRLPQRHGDLRRGRRQRKGMRKAPRRTNDPDRTRRDIVEVATREFAQKGYSGARVDAIASRTRTSKRMIYYYFGSKEGLYLAVLEEAYSSIRRAEATLDLENCRLRQRCAPWSA